jgi:hypothetical protein
MSKVLVERCLFEVRRGGEKRHRSLRGAMRGGGMGMGWAIFRFVVTKILVLLALGFLLRQNATPPFLCDLPLEPGSWTQDPRPRILNPAVMGGSVGKWLDGL